MIKLNEDWYASGDDIQTFKETINELSKCTKHVRVNGTQLSVLSKTAGITAEETPGKVYFWDLNAQTLCDMKTTGALTPKKAKNTSPTLMAEALRDVGFILKYEGKGAIPLYVSAGAIPTLCARAKVGGEKISRPSLFRDMAIAETLTRADTGMTLVIREQPREDGGLDRKVFAAMSEKYMPIPMGTINKALDMLMQEKALGKPVCKGWYVNHSFAECLIEFPDANITEDMGLEKGLIPGVMLMSSDTGESSLIIRGTYRVSGTKRCVITDEVKQRHSGSVEFSDMLDRIDDTILANIRKLPEALLERRTRSITLASTDLSTKRGIAENKKLILSAIKIGSKNLGLVKAVGKKREKELIDSLSYEIVGDKAMTEYDVAMIFLGLADRVVGLNRHMQVKLAKALAKAPYVSYLKKEEKSKELYLVA